MSKQVGESPFVGKKGLANLSDSFSRVSTLLDVIERVVSFGSHGAWLGLETNLFEFSIAPTL